MDDPLADSRNPSTMTPHERRQEIAAILARGVLRLHHAAQSTSGSRPSRTSEESAELRENRLDAGRKSSPHVLAL